MILRTLVDNIFDTICYLLLDIITYATIKFTMFARNSHDLFSPQSLICNCKHQIKCAFRLKLFCTNSSQQNRSFDETLDISVICARWSNAEHAFY